jgi:hypothetical protein
VSSVKRCVQCGLLKEADAFRKYTYSKQHGTEGRYRICKACEAINAAYRRAKQLLSQVSWTDDLEKAMKVEQAHRTIKKTDKLYDVLRARGLRVPTDPAVPETQDNIDTLLEFYAAEAPVKSTVAIAPAPVDIPDELTHWLTVDTREWAEANISPEYLQETVYESLRAKYRPQVGVDKDTYLPIYDDTYKSVLNDILRRFDDYEEECSLIEEEGE